MTYYEELGVQPDATVPQIRQAYKLLARLLHPDAQPDPELRALAECQMKRLGEVVGVLSNPRLRSKYDAGLRASWTRRPGKPWWVGWTGRHWFEIAIGAMVLTVGTWWLATRDADGMGQAPLPPPAPEARAAVHEPARAEKGRPPGLPPRPETTRKEEPRVPALEEASPVPETPMAEEPVRAALTAARKPEPGPAATAVDGSPFAGNWLYIPAEKEAAVAGQYPASYVELLLRQENGELVGHYRSRHRIPDRAISPEVLLQIRGRRGEGISATLPWTSADGGKGELDVTLREANILKVNWWTTEFGGRGGLSSGTAVLIRQVAP